jgi:hypothetical protein
MMHAAFPIASRIARRRSLAATSSPDSAHERWPARPKSAAEGRPFVPGALPVYPELLPEQVEYVAEQLLQLIARPA